MPEDQDWRLEAELDGAAPSGGLDHLLGRIRGHDEVRDDVQGAVGDDVVVTHDGRLLFAYAATTPAIETARGAIEGVLRADGYTPRITVAHWDHDLDDWTEAGRSTDSQARRAERAAVHDADVVETRTLICTAGKLVRETLEQSMTARATELGIRCQAIEHPHLLTTQVAFTIAGPRRKLDQFHSGLRAEERATIRADSIVMNPL